MAGVGILFVTGPICDLPTTANAQVRCCDRARNRRSVVVQRTPQLLWTFWKRAFPERVPGDFLLAISTLLEQLWQDQHRASSKSLLPEGVVVELCATRSACFLAYFRVCFSCGQPSPAQPVCTRVRCRCFLLSFTMCMQYVASNCLPCSRNNGDPYSLVRVPPNNLTNW